MAKLKYDSKLVTNTLDELGVASNQLIDTEEKMRSALTIIANARGIHHVHTDTLFNTIGFPSACQEMIEDTITNLKNRAAEIEEYNEKYENASFLEKLGSTAGLFLTKICEGFASAGEQIVDGFASIIGFGAGLVSKKAQNSIANFIKKDYVGDFFGNLYDNSLKNMVAKSWANEKGLACNIFKGIGTGVGYAVALAGAGAIGGGIATGTSLGAKAGATYMLSSLPAAATAAGVAGIGAGTQTGLKGGLDYSQAFGYGLKYGAIQAGTTIVFTYAFKALSKGWNMLKTKMSGNASTTGASTINNTAGGTAEVGAGVVDDAASAADDAARAAASKELSSIKSSMRDMGGRLLKKRNALVDAEAVLDDAIAQGADDATIATLEKNVSLAQKAYDKQYQSLLTKQQQYVDITSGGDFNKIGTEGTKKLIIGDITASPNTVAGDITTYQIGTRPNWTNATATVEGHISKRTFAKLLDDQYGPVIPTPLPTVPPTVETGAGAGANAIIFGVVEPKEIVPTPSITITPAPVIPITQPPIVTTPPTVTQPPIITTPPVVTQPPIITPPPVVTQPPIITTPPIVTQPPIITTPPIVTQPPIITTPPIVTQPPIITPPPVVTQPPIITTPAPSPDLEYVPIPNTGIGSERPKMGFAPVIAGAAAGIAGIVGGSLLKGKEKKYKDADVEELESESEE